MSWSCDEGAHDDVLALARRDAERTGPQAPERLTELTAQGLRVARLITGTAWRTELAALGEAGVETEVLGGTRDRHGLGGSDRPGAF